MSSERPCWEIYQKEMSHLDRGHALWEPAPLPYFERIKPGDVGYIRAGCFHLLFSAGCPLGKRRPGVDVPRNFKQLEVGPIFSRQALAPGCLPTKGVRATRARLTPQIPPPPASTVPMLELGITLSFRLEGGQGAALVTKYQTHREDIQRTGTFEEYTKEHYASWVAFASANGHGKNIKPVLVTGVDMTGDFAMMSYSDDDDNLRSEFTTTVTGVASASAWGTWCTAGFIHTNCGPQPRLSLPSTQTVDPAPSGNHNMETVLDECTQCVFVRYYTMRKKVGIPRIMKAGAGPHNLGPGDRGDEESPEVEAQSASDSGSDIVSGLSGDSGVDDGSSVTSISSGSDVVIHNTAVDGRDDFDVIADYVFQNSDAGSVLIHHRDIALLREPGDSTDLSVQLHEKQPPITVDENGVGMVDHQTDPSANTLFNDSLGVTPATPSPAPGESEHGTTDWTALLEPPSPPHSEFPPPGYIEAVATDLYDLDFYPHSARTDFELLDDTPNIPVNQYHVRGQSSGEVPGLNYDLDEGVAEFLSDSDGPQTPKKRKRATTPDETRELKRARSQRPRGLYPQEQTQMAPPAALSTRPDLHIVEQVPYRCTNSQGGWTPIPSIDFKTRGMEGIKLTDAMNMGPDDLDDRDEPMFTNGVGDAVRCRINFVGYSAHTKPRKIATTNYKPAREPITKDKLACEVVRCIKAYLTGLESGGTPFPICFEDMFLTKLVNVSRGSWQPEIWYQNSPSTSS